MTRPRVAFVTPTLDAMGGTEQIAMLEAKALMQRADVTFFVPVSEVKPVAGADVVAVKHPKLPGVFADEAWFAAASKAIKNRQPGFDAIYSPGVNCDCATHINVYANFSEWVELHKGLPIKNSFREAQRRLRFRRLSAWERRLYKKPELKLATISVLAAERLRHDFGRDDVVVFPSTPEPGRFTPAIRTELRTAARDELRLGADTFAVVTLGNAWYSKGFDLLYDVWRKLELGRPMQLIVVTTEREDHLKRMLGELPLDTRLVSRVRQVERLYAAADLVVLASRGETFGLPIAEAGAMHVPVRVSALAGVSSYVPDPCVVKPNTAATWHEAIAAVAVAPPEEAELRFVADRLAQNSAHERALRLADWVLG